MVRNVYTILSGIYVTLQFYSPAQAQEHLIQQTENRQLQKLEEQYRQGFYTVSLQTANQLIAHRTLSNDVSFWVLPTAQFYQVQSLLKLRALGAEDSALQFISTVTNPNFKQRTSFALAQYYFNNKQYSKAIKLYETVPNINLSNEEIVELKFQQAYAYFYEKNFEKAARLFETIKGMEGKYANAGNYYNGLLAYNLGKYEDAMTCFSKIEKDPKYVMVVPFYQAEILYFTGKSEDALAKTITLINAKDKSYYDNELHLLAAQILFEKKQYKDAIPYFEHYYEQSEQVRKEELYEFAYSYYKTKQWNQAIDKFKPLSNNEDTLGQTAMYLMGDAYLKINDKRSARNAFSIAGNLSFIKSQKIDALLQYSKLSYEMGFYDDAMSGLSTLIALLPDATVVSQAKTIYSELLSRTNNYERAYQMLKEADSHTSQFESVYQRVTYGYALQLLQQGNLNEASQQLDLSLKHPANKAYELAGLFWKGDIAYQQGKYQESYNYSKRFVDANSNSAMYLSAPANMGNGAANLGYAAMKLNDFTTAQVSFKNAQQQATQLQNPTLTVNALLREADAYYMLKNYKSAAALYDKVIAANAIEADYARLQKATIAGINQSVEEKIKLLNQVINKTPASTYQAAARFELGITYLEEDKYALAITALKPLIEKGASRDFEVKARMKIAYAFQQLNKDKEAIEAYKYIVTQYPGTDEKQEALEALRNLYINNNQPDAYAALLKTLNTHSDEGSALDSTYYAAAETLIAQVKWADAKSSLNNYLLKYPNGVFTTRAHYYLGESNFQLKDYEAALANYDWVLQLPWNEFTENSAKKAATISYFNKKDYTKALHYYQQLRNAALAKENLPLAYLGMTRAAFNSQQFELASLFADTLQSLPDMDKNLIDEANFYKAKVMVNHGAIQNALTIFTQLKATENTLIADEAKYQVAALLFKNGKVAEAETQAAENLKSASNNNYWVVKSYLLLADIMLQQKDYFNAKATLQSIVKNTKFEDLKTEATTKLTALKAIEKKQSKLSDK